MGVSLRVRRSALLVLVIVAVVPQRSLAQQVVCWPITRGDTAAGLAERLTGDAANRHASWFHIVDPVSGKRLPKARYDTIPVFWRACIPREMLKTGVEQFLKPAITASAVQASANSMRPDYQLNVGFAWRIGLVVWVFLLAWLLIDRYSATMRPVPPSLRRAGEQFVHAFARPLVEPLADAPPIRARLRFIPRLEQLHILIAPNAGRQYPNLSDHKKNVEYDIDRILRLLGNELVVSDRLRAEGQWVVIPVRFKAGLKEAGAK